MSCGNTGPGGSADLAEKRIMTTYCVRGTLQSTSLMLSDTGITLRAKCYQKDHFTDEKTNAYVISNISAIVVQSHTRAGEC